jgi:anti-sigma factor RsiW
MEHKELEDKILLLRDGRLSREETRLAEAHLADCAECRALLADAEKIKLFAAPLPPASDRFVLSVMSKISKAETESPLNRFMSLLLNWWVPVLTVELAFALLLFLLPSGQQQDVTLESVIGTGAAISTADTAQDQRASYISNLLGVSAEEQ